MAVTSAADPAAGHLALPARRVRHRRVTPWRGLPDLVLFDRDGTLVHDFPYNGDPDLGPPGRRREARRWTGCAPAACGSAWSATSPASPAG